MENRRVAAIVPAFNEEGSVGEVLRVLLSSKVFDEVILVDDGSEDATAKIAEDMGVRVIKMKERVGKGGAMKEGVNATNAEVIAFFDADLIGLSEKHISAIINPVLSQGAEMCVGISDRWFGLPGVMAKIDPLFAISGQRGLKKSLFEKLPGQFARGFAVETSLNYLCLSNNLPIAHVPLKGLNIIVKEKKWRIFRGFSSRIEMVFEILKVRILFFFYKNEFIQKNNDR